MGRFTGIAILTLCGAAMLGAQQHKIEWSDREKPLVEQMRKLRSMPDDERARVTRQLALEIRALPAGPHKEMLADGLSNLVTEGDPGAETLQEVATTLSEVLRAQPVPADKGQPAMPYVTLAQLVRYEHVHVICDDPQFAAAMAKLEAADKIRQEANFTLSDLAGKQWTLRDLRGKVVLVNFWATWCPPCRKEMPDLDALYHEFGPQGLVILAISDEEAGKVQPFIAEHHISYPILLDPGRKVNELFQVEGIPKSFVYGRDGRLVAEAIDMRTRRQFLAMLAQAGLQPPAAAAPSAWVPARWDGSNSQSLDRIADTPINCLLVETYTPDFLKRASERRIATLLVLKPGPDPADPARKAVQAGMQGVVLEGDFPKGTAVRVRDALADTHAIVVEITSRSRMPLGGSDPIVGTYHGVWPGIEVMENGAAKAAPSGSPWIDTNTGFVRSVRAWGPASVWLGYLPPAHSVITGERYIQAVSDAELAGARWIVALDGDFSARLARGDAGALKDWHAMMQVLEFFEGHPEWRDLPSYGRLAVVQDRDDALLSGGILDMIAAKHTPMRAIPGQRLTADALHGATMAVDVDAAALTPEQRDILKNFARAGNTVLTAPPGWQGQSALGAGQITLDKAELDRLNDIWHDVQTMTGRKNLGARLFNVSSMLSNVAATPDGKEVIVELVNYSAYP
ncbi:MAG TPA: redoxin domain-containing protein, partial [Bryobacteraceae bacterium]|nr:redoxin domain-containing protein [Bryobacteraceae bacterium]